MIGSQSMKSNFLAGSLQGSLPRGLSVDERRLIAQSTPLSPSMNMLSAMPSVRPCCNVPGPVLAQAAEDCGSGPQRGRAQAHCAEHTAVAQHKYAVRDALGAPLITSGCHDHCRPGRACCPQCPRRAPAQLPAVMTECGPKRRLIVQSMPLSPSMSMLSAAPSVHPCTPLAACGRGQGLWRGQAVRVQGSGARRVLLSCPLCRMSPASAVLVTSSSWGCAVAAS